MPEHFDLPGALEEAPLHDNVLTFLATQFTGERGDVVYLCFGGKQRPGLYATATVLTDRARIAPEAWQLRYGRKTLEADQKSELPYRVRLKIHHRLAEPVPRGRIYALPEMAGHKFVTFRRGTNFPLTAAQASAIEQLIEAQHAPGVDRAGRCGGRTSDCGTAV